MIGMLLGMLIGDEVRMLPLLNDPPKIVKADRYLINSDSLFEERDLHPRHTMAFLDIQSFVVRRDPRVAHFSVFNFDLRGDSKKFRSDHWFPVVVPLRIPTQDPAKVDKDGNTLLSRLMMSHFIITEPVALKVFSLLKQENKLNMKPNRLGQTPLMLAVEAGWPEVVSKLVQLGANLELKDRNGRDAIDYIGYSAIRPSDRFCAAVPVYNIDLIADVLVENMPNRVDAQARLRPIISAVRKFAQKIDFSNGIVP